MPGPTARPILMLTAADWLDDKASGFGLGADDYPTKPFELREFVLRLRGCGHLLELDCPSQADRYLVGFLAPG